MHSSLPFSGKQPLKRLAKFPTDSEQNLRADLTVSVLHGGKIALTDTYPPREFRLRDVEATQFPNSPPHGLPVNGASLRSRDFS
jgi:hypothetical protein